MEARRFKNNTSGVVQVITTTLQKNVNLGYATNYNDQGHCPLGMLTALRPEDGEKLLYEGAPLDSRHGR